MVEATDAVGDTNAYLVSASGMVVGETGSAVSPSSVVSSEKTPPLKDPFWKVSSIHNKF